MNVAQETLGFRRAGLSPALSLLMSAFALPIPPARFTPNLHRPTERSPTMYAIPSACSVTHDSTLRVALASAVSLNLCTIYPCKVSLVRSVARFEHTQVDCVHPHLRLLA